MDELLSEDDQLQDVLNLDLDEEAALLGSSDDELNNDESGRRLSIVHERSQNNPRNKQYPRQSNEDLLDASLDMDGDSFSRENGHTPCLDEPSRTLVTTEPKYQANLIAVSMVDDNAEVQEDFDSQDLKNVEAFDNQSSQQNENDGDREASVSDSEFDDESDDDDHRDRFRSERGGATVTSRRERSEIPDSLDAVLDVEEANKAQAFLDNKNKRPFHRGRNYNNNSNNFQRRPNPNYVPCVKVPNINLPDPQKVLVPHFRSEKNDHAFPPSSTVGHKKQHEPVAGRGYQPPYVDHNNPPYATNDPYCAPPSGPAYPERFVPPAPFYPPEPFVLNQQPVQPFQNDPMMLHPGPLPHPTSHFPTPVGNTMTHLQVPSAVQPDVWSHPPPFVSEPPPVQPMPSHFTFSGPVSNFDHPYPVNTYQDNQFPNPGRLPTNQHQMTSNQPWFPPEQQNLMQHHDMRHPLNFQHNTNNARQPTNFQHLEKRPSPNFQHQEKRSNFQHQEMRPNFSHPDHRPPGRTDSHQHGKFQQQGPHQVPVQQSQMSQNMRQLDQQRRQREQLQSKKRAPNFGTMNLPVKQQRLESSPRKPIFNQKVSNIKEIPLVDTFPQKVPEPKLPEKKPEPMLEDEDEETRDYRKRVEQQKKVREEILLRKELRRKQMAMQRTKEIEKQNVVSEVKTGIVQSGNSARGNKVQQVAAPPPEPPKKVLSVRERIGFKPIEAPLPGDQQTTLGQKRQEALAKMRLNNNNDKTESTQLTTAAIPVGPASTIAAPVQEKLQSANLKPDQQIIKPSLENVVPAKTPAAPTVTEVSKILPVSVASLKKTDITQSKTTITTTMSKISSLKNLPSLEERQLMRQKKFGIVNPPATDSSQTVMASTTPDIPGQPKNPFQSNRFASKPGLINSGALPSQEAGHMHFNIRNQFHLGSDYGLPHDFRARPMHMNRMTYTNPYQSFPGRRPRRGMPTRFNSPRVPFEPNSAIRPDLMIEKPLPMKNQGTVVPAKEVVEAEKPSKVVLETVLPIVESSAKYEAASEQKIGKSALEAKSTSKSVEVRNLSSSTSKLQLEKIATSIGPIEDVQLSKTDRIANIVFKESSHALQFQNKFQRYMLDLSMIEVILPPS